jgi:hypothetical protein
MKIKNIYILILFAFFIGTQTMDAQELNAKVVVSAPISTTVDPSVYQSLEKAMTELLNNTRWSEDEFEGEEKIDLNVQLTITSELSPTAFEGELIVQSSRPVFNSLYSTPLLNHVDRNVTFSFIDQQVLQKSNVSYTDNLSSILSYYAYLILGLDYDSFSLYGGDANFQYAQDVVNNLSSGVKSDPGWKIEGLTKTNRYWILENILNPRVRPYRQAIYEYHRLGLDDMVDDPDRKRAIISSAITAIGDVNQSIPNSIIMQIFANTKREELVEIFKVDERGPRSKIRNIMAKIDPANASKYDDLK